MKIKISASVFEFFALIFATIKPSVGDSSSVESNESSQVNKAPVDLRVDVTDDYIPFDLKQALVKAVLSKDPSLNQYSPEIGTYRMRKAVATLYSKRINIDLDPDQHVLVTVGAHSALYAAFQALTTTPGDEWIIFEPFWSKFPPMITLSKGVPRYTNFKLNVRNSSFISGNDWMLDRDELEKSFNSRTKGILLNNPNNPSGKVFSLDDLKFIASLARKHKVIVISDEVHEWVVYKPYEHIKFASLPGMFNQTITIGSASKSFGVAGWRIGWAFGPVHLMNKLKHVHGYMVHSSPTPQQDAVAYALEKEYRDFGKSSSFFSRNLKKSTQKRNFLVNSLRNAGMEPIVPNGGNCMIVGLPKTKNNDADHNVSVSDLLKQTVGVIGFPMVDFYGPEHKYIGKNSVRYCFQKSDETLENAAYRLDIYKNNL